MQGVFRLNAHKQSCHHWCLGTRHSHIHLSLQSIVKNAVDIGIDLDTFPVRYTRPILTCSTKCSCVLRGYMKVGQFLLVDTNIVKMVDLA